MGQTGYPCRTPARATPPSRQGGNGPGLYHDLHKDLDNRAGLNNHTHARAENRRRTPSELRRDVARYRGAAHPLCFTNEVMEHEFPEGFKPMTIESYDGSTDPVVWIEDFLLHIHMAGGDDLHAI